MTFLLFIFILSILILVHEAGHFFAARKFGVRVEQFALGFGPKLLSKKFGETEYSICLIPLGGFVKMAGDDKAQCAGKPDEYFSKSLLQRAWIVLMGPAVNYVMAFFCFVLVFMIGYVDVQESNKLLPAVVGQVMAGTPAQFSGLQPEDRIIAVGERSIGHWAQMQETIAAWGAKEMLLRIERQGEVLSVSLTPQMRATKDIFGREKQVSIIGIQPRAIDSRDQLVIKKYGFIGACKHGALELYRVTAQTYEALGQIITGKRNAKEGMTGLVGMFFIIKFAADIGISTLLHVVGVVNASLAIFNLFPILPLDGGHLLMIIIEKIRGKALSAKWDDMVARLGFGLIIALAAFVFYADFERIGLIDKAIKIFNP